MSRSTALPPQIVPLLLNWYDRNARILPWRENTQPYRVWVSEIMLQQTQVAAVKPYFDRFIAEIPDIESLARIETDKLLKLWEGLGYYNRARNLQKAAQIILEEHGGLFPEDEHEILALPGIGAYTAGAIASICFGKPAPAVDGNVLRVITRLTGDDGDITSARVKAEISGWLKEIYPRERSGDFTQSLMELGATICLPKVRPRCDACPIRDLCVAFKTQRQADFPVKTPKKPRAVESKTVFMLCCKDKIAVRRRDSMGLLSGLWELPNTEGKLSPDEASYLLDEWGIQAVSMEKGMDKKHIFTHREWRMQSYIVQCADETDRFVWVTQTVLKEEITLPSAFQGFLEGNG